MYRPCDLWCKVSRCRKDDSCQVVKAMKEISVFEPQEINGFIIEPLCIPSSERSISHTVAGATNLLWFSFNLAIAENNREEAEKLSEMIKIVITRDMDANLYDEMDDAINSLD